jgi:hypothetical protein
LVVNAPDHPARNVNIENDSVPVGNDYTDPLIVGGSAIELINEQLHKIIEELKLMNALLGEIGK